MVQMTVAALKALAQAQAGGGCERCAPLAHPGWEAMPAGFAERDLRQVGTLRDGPDGPTWEEHPPTGPRTWAPETPIALRFHPCNRSDVWVCVGCGRPFLRYTEFGGYYVEQRVRLLDAALIVD